MAGPQTNVLRRAWYLWKSLRLPWRKRFFVGQDISGNTYYELRLPRGDAPSNTANRRLVHYPRSTHYSEVRVPPAWHQWLRYQRESPPSMQEQVTELQRQARIKVLAAEADARWEAKPSLLDMPVKTNEPEQGRRETSETQEGARQRSREDVQTKQSHQVDPDNDPWKRAQKGAPGETWQPEAWTPTSAGKR